MSAGSKFAVMGVVAAAVGFGLRQGVIAMRGETVVPKATLTEQQNQIDGARQAEAQAKTRADTTQSELERAKMELADREKALNDVKAHAADLSNQVQVASARADEEAARGATRDAELAKANEQLRAAETLAKKLQDEASKNDSKLRDATAQAAKSDAKVSELNTKLAKLQSEADLAKRDVEARLAAAEKSGAPDGEASKWLEQTPKTGVAYYARRRGAALVDRRFEVCEADGAASKSPDTVPVAGQYARARVFVNVQAQAPAYDTAAKAWTSPDFVGAFAPGRVVRIEETLSDFPGGEIWIRYAVAD